MKHLTLGDVRKQSCKALGFGADIVDVESPEFIAAALRRAASSLCPCSGSRLVKVVQDSLNLILSDRNYDLKGAIQHSLESLISNGDLIEQDEISTSKETKLRGKILYLRPPSFIRGSRSSLFLIGVSSNNATILSPEIEQRVDYYQHVRRLSVRHNENLDEKLKSIGLKEIPVESWDRKNSIPESEIPSNYISKFKSFLKENPGTLEDAQILNPDKYHVRFYTRRWEPIRKQTGFFIAKRPQIFGNDLWCFLELQAGVPIKMADFPVLNKELFGRDEAWRLQMAIDAEREKPQEFSIVQSSQLYKRVKFYSPIPSWAQRRWDNIAQPDSNDGCLFSYKFKGVEIAQEIDFIKEKLWLKENSNY